jgi:peptide/nickel transport system substrate-binding protein
MSEKEKLAALNRRRFIESVAAVGGAGMLAGCGGPSNVDTTTGAGETTENDGGETDTDESTASGEQPEGGTFVNTTGEAANTLDPRVNELAWVSNLVPYIFDGLLIQNPDGSGMVPHVAAEMPTRVDETTYTVQMKEGVTFHNGDEMTAEDVAYTYNWILDPENQSVRRQDISFMNGVEVLGDYEVQFDLANPYALFFETLGMEIVPMAVASEQGPDDFGQEPVGSGPFQFVNWEKSSQITLERYDEYFLQLPNLDTVEYRVIPEAQVQYVELATGGVNQASVPNELLQRAESESNINMVTLDTFDYNGICFNALREPFDDVRVREAMHYAVDFGELIEATKGVLGDRPYGFMPKSVNEAWGFPWQDWDEQYFPEKDHEEATRLLEEAGYGDGFGKTLNMVSLGSSDFSSMSIILQRELDELGYSAEITEQTIGQWIDTLNKDQYDMIDYGWTGGVDPDEFFYFLMRDLTNDDGWEQPSEDWAGNTSAGMLHQAYPDDDDLARADELIREARRLTDREERRSTYVEAANILQSKYPHLQVFSEKSAVAYTDDVKDYELTSFSVQPLCNEWNNAYVE